MTTLSLQPSLFDLTAIPFETTGASQAELDSFVNSVLTSKESSLRLQVELFEDFLSSLSSNAPICSAEGFVKELEGSPDRPKIPSKYHRGIDYALWVFESQQSHFLSFDCCCIANNYSPEQLRAALLDTNLAHYLQILFLYDYLSEADRLEITEDYKAVMQSQINREPFGDNYE
jgi:hypothetical protein